MRLLVVTSEHYSLKYWGISAHVINTVQGDFVWFLTPFYCCLIGFRSSCRRLDWIANEKNVYSMKLFHRGFSAKIWVWARFVVVWKDTYLEPFNIFAQFHLFVYNDTTEVCVKCITLYSILIGYILLCLERGSDIIPFVIYV